MRRNKTILSPCHTHLGAGRPADQGLARIAHLEGGRSLDVIPVLLGEGICAEPCVMAQNGQGGPQLDEQARTKFILLFCSPGSERMQRCLTLGLLLATLLSLGKLLVLSDSHFADVARRKDETKQKEALPAANPEPRNAVHTLEAAAASS